MSWYMGGKIGLPCFWPQWQFKRVKGPLLKPYQIIEFKVRGPRCPCVNLLAQQPFWFNALRTSPPKDVSGDCSSNYPQSPNQPSRGWECNRRWRDQRPLSPQFPSPSLDHGFKRKIEGCYQQHLQCHPDLTTQMDQGVSNKVDNTEKKHARR